jgi:hypothetical protein
MLAGLPKIICSLLGDPHIGSPTALHTKPPFDA